jgi:outer membrane receptor for ferrienterochelin and colicins
MRWVCVLALSFSGVTSTARAADASETVGPFAGISVQDLDALSLQELLELPVEVASRKRESASEAPAVVTVLTREHLEAWSYKSLAQVLNAVTGFFVVDDHVLPDAGVRGVSGGLFAETNNLKVLINGEAVSFRTTGGHWIGDELIPLSAVERIEIVRGPASALYGANAFLGVVNVITRAGIDLSGASALLGAGSVAGRRDDGTVDLSLGAARGALDALVALRLNEADRPGLRLPDTSPRPQLPSYRSSDDRAARRDDASQVLYARLGYQLDEATKVTAHAYYSGFSRRAEFAPWAQLTTGLSPDGHAEETRIALEQGQVGVALDKALGATADLRTRSLLFWGSPRRDDRIEVASDIFYVERDLGFVGTEQRLEVDLRPYDFITGSAGVEYTFDREQLPSKRQVLKRSEGDLPAGAVLETQSVRQPERDFQNIGGFLQARVEPFARLLQLHGAVRFDYHSVYHAQLAGRLAAISNPLDELTIKLIYGSAFKAPSPYLMHAIPYRIGDVIGNPELEPQHVNELALQVLTTPWSFLSITSDVSYDVITGMAEFQQQGFNRAARNVSEVESLAWNTEVRARLESRIDAHASFEKVWARRERQGGGYVSQLLGDSNPVYPSWVARGGVMARARELHARLGVSGMFVGPRQASDANSLEAGERYELPPYFILRAVLSTEGVELLEARDLTLSLVGDNLLGAKGPNPGFGGVDYPLEPRTFYLELRQEL